MCLWFHSRQLQVSSLHLHAILRESPHQTPSSSRTQSLSSKTLRGWTLLEVSTARSTPPPLWGSGCSLLAHPPPLALFLNLSSTQQEGRTGGGVGGSCSLSVEPVSPVLTALQRATILRLKSTVRPGALKALGDLAPVGLSQLLSPILPLLTQFQPHWPSLYCSKAPSSFPPQDLCTCFSLSLADYTIMQMMAAPSRLTPPHVSSPDHLRLCYFLQYID